MKLLDKYIFRTFLVPWAYCLIAFIFLYVIYDLFDHMDNFVEAEIPLLEVATFYFFLLPSVLKIILPVSLLLAVLYALYQLTKSNEIIAMRASGVGLYRVVLPFLLVGLGLSLLLTLNEETLAPWSAKRSDFYLRSIKEPERAEAAYVYKTFAYYNSLKHRSWSAKTYDVRDHHLEDLSLRQERNDGSLEMIMTAKRAEWLDERWVLSDVEIEYYDEEGLKRPRFAADGTPLPQKETHKWMELDPSIYNEHPNLLEVEKLSLEHLSSTQIARFVRHHPGMSDQSLAGYQTNFHMKLAMPWACLVVTMLGIPFGNQTARKGALTGISLCLGLFFLYFFMISFFKTLGISQSVGPFLAAWFPNILFLSVAGVLMLRMQ